MRGAAGPANETSAHHRAPRRTVPAASPLSYSFPMPATTDQVPERLRAALAERYTLEREIGRGGMATVYLARDKKHGRAVALKVLHPVLAGRSYEPDRFLREIRFAARLVHPGILPLHDSGERDGFLYFVMPFVDAETLRDRMRREGRLSVEDVIPIAHGLAAALDYAHREGVLHRDLKPENVLLHEGGPLLADFGVARAICECDRGEGDITEGGLAVGTPQYMSPEQASGDRELDGRSDQYALACVVYEMLAGEPPFGSGSPRALIARQVTQAARPLRTLRPEVPAAVDAALTRALAKDPTERFPTVLAFAEALAAQDGPAAGPSGRAGAIAVLPFVNLSRDPDAEYLSDGLTEELMHALTQVAGLRVASRTSVFAFKGAAEDVRAIGARLGVSAVLEGSVGQAGTRLRVTARLTSVADGHHLWAGRYDREVQDVFAIQEEIAGTIVQTLRATLVGPVGDVAAKRHTENVRAYRLYLKGRFAWNKRTAEGTAEAIHLFEQAIAEDPGFALAYAGLSDAHSLDVDYRGIPVADGFARARELARQALALDEGLAEAHTSLAWVLFIHDWDWAGAFEHFRRAIALDPAYATAHQWYAFPLVAHGRFGEAVAEARMAQELDPASVAIRRGVGWILYYARRFDEAAEGLERAVALCPTSEETQRVLGLAQLGRGAWAEAEGAFREALALSGVSAHPTAELGTLLARTGRTDEARGLLGELYARAAQRYVSPAAFAELHIALGELDRAFEWMERAYSERRGWLAYLRVNPLFDPLRGDPRFTDLLRRLRL